VRLPVPEAGGATLAELAGFAVAAAAYLAGHRRGAVVGWGAGHADGLVDGENAERWRQGRPERPRRGPRPLRDRPVS